MSKRLISILCALTAAAVSVRSQEAPNPRRALDRKLQALMAKWHVPGGSVAILREGRFVYARGLGTAAPDRRTPVRRNSLFRIASVSKPITAAAILTLVEQGRLRLDDRVLDKLPQYREEVRDVRVRDITVRNLLQHSGGWDSSVSGDPVYPTWQELQALGASIPPRQDEIIRYWLSQPLEFTPGTREAYSNFGYVLLGRVIEAVTGVPYERWTAEHVLIPGGFHKPRQGGSLEDERAGREVKYANYPGALRVYSVFSQMPELTPEPYGGYALKVQDSAGGWLASAPELACFVSRLAGGALLKPETVALISQRPSFTPESDAYWYGLGMVVIPAPGGFLWGHDGAFPGAVSSVLHVPGLLTYAALFNSKPQAHEAFLAEVQKILIEAAAGMAGLAEDEESSI